MNAPVFLPAMAVATCLGIGKAATMGALLAGDRSGLRRHQGDALPLGRLPTEPGGHGDSRNNRLLAMLLEEIAEPLARAIERYGRDRVAVVVGTSTSGIAEGEVALAQRLKTGHWPAGFTYAQQETGSAASFIADALGLGGPAYVVGTACSSSAKVFASARRLIRQGLADAAIVGGADTLCRLTVAGFSALEAVAPEPCLPFSAHRRGITLGEGGALFLLTPEPAEIALLGVGESSDAHHLSAPDPEGHGARDAMQAALADAGLDPRQIGYVNLHGTATQLNDAMEARAVNAVFGPLLPCSSTKALTGHTLGAAGAVEAALLWLTLSAEWNPSRLLPPQAGTGQMDDSLPPLHLVAAGEAWPMAEKLAALSSSFAFGGSNCALVLGRGWGI
ncbi:beta-ketoacyl-[acyl-carrier-protein] synthase family protein [Magnetospirillum sulfuroxidans]|uniref:Beta-ketoacyl-[acyl-carrier-protein] synthase family protein n=1 Tax=Magnetospirillum sulfuroxidans TaxID=611300 RepID=A0ABS5I7G5_9PROT|nr:beta-ketoacyl-[acyl-carrier-protein] synthase family protein [Magnetospirillum sulfuroxidans]MBR9970186.1 beta-ketoacyl-[acyl-carrier-protein] synthase family protein [Magnetospirillum sulfuroxidans]